MDQNVISIRTGLPWPAPLTISEHTVTIGDADYVVRRAADADGRGFVTINDAVKRPVLIFSASIPDDDVPQLIVAWRAGFQSGLARGRREVASAQEAQP